MAHHDDHDHEVVERFHPTSGRVTGWLTVGLAGLLVVVGLAYLDDGFPPWVVAAGLLVGVLSWAAMLRPALWATRDHLVMRNLAETVHIRLAAVEEMAVRQVLAVRAADRRFVSTVVGRTWRKTLQSAIARAAWTRVPRWPPPKACTTPTSRRTGSTTSWTPRARPPAYARVRRSSWRCQMPYAGSVTGCRSR